MSRLAISAGLIVTVLISFPGAAQASENQITITGGGWGHGIGMSQYGAQALATSGSNAEDIVKYFYTGVSISQVGTGNLIAGSDFADPLRIGVGQNLTRIDFSPQNGQIQLGDALIAQVGEMWSLRMISDGSCQFFHGENPQGDPITPCNGSITWSPQPDVRVYVSTLNRTYARGSIVFVQVPNDSGRFHLVVEVPLEQYLYGLAEMPSSWSIEALKAQAIAGRTYALYKAHVYLNLESNGVRMNSCACHLYSSTYDQAYTGWAKESEVGSQNWGARWVGAVDATAGEVLTHTYSDGRAIEAYYFSSSGGATENNDDVWGGAPYPYLRSVTDPGPTSWSVTMSQSQFAHELGFDNVLSVAITETFVSGSPKKIVVKGYTSGSPLTKTFSGNQLRSIFGLRSHFIKQITGIVPFIPGADQAVLHDPTTGTWLYNTASGPEQTIYYGNPGDTGFMGDWDCDGVDTPGLYRRSDGYVYLRNSNTQGIADVSFFFGNPGDVAVPGDFNGDGCDTVSIYRPSEGQFYVINELGSADKGLGAADYSYYYGNPGDVPFAGDWDGDGVDTPGLRRASNGFVYLRNSNTAGVADLDYYYGDPGDLVFAGDWDADGDDTLGLYRPSNGTVYLRNTNSTGSADIAYKAGGSKHHPVAGTP